MNPSKRNALHREMHEVLAAMAASCQELNRARNLTLKQMNKVDFENPDDAEVFQSISAVESLVFSLRSEIEQCTLRLAGTFNCPVEFKNDR